MKNARNIGDAPIGRVEEAALKGGGCEAKPPGGACRGPQMRQAVSCNAGRICAPPVWARGGRASAKIEEEGRAISSEESTLAHGSGVLPLGVASRALASWFGEGIPI